MKAYLESEEVARMEQAATNLRDRLLIRLLFRLGCRVSEAMAIKWSAVKVSEAMDEVEQQVLLADQFIAEAKTKAEAAKRIGNLPQYMEHRLNRLIDQLERMEYIKGAITAIRNDIPDGAIEAERANLRHGSTQSLI